MTEIWPIIAEYANIALKLAVGLCAFVIVLRTTNKGQLTQMTPVDLIGNFVLGGIIGGIIYNGDVGVIKFIIVLVIWQVLVIGVNKYRKYTESGRKIVVGSVIPLIKNGKLLQENFKENEIDIGDFVILLRMKGICSMEEVNHAQMEPNGQLTVTKKGEPPCLNVVIKNGAIDDSALDILGYDEAWLMNKLHKAGYDCCDKIFYAEFINNNSINHQNKDSLFIIEKLPDQQSK